jgi:serine-type D-Ala-D-Ala carboxypeptidase/endopeptidase (penicillin-binding protein 4)
MMLSKFIVLILLFFSIPNVVNAQDIQNNYKFSDLFEDYMTHPFFSESDVGIQVVNVRTKEEVFAYNADEEFTPASVMKAVTSAVALQELGTEYRYRTDVKYTGEINASGVLKGNVYIVGSGDPYINGEVLWKMVRDMKVAGVNAIHGNIYFDDSLFAGTTYIPGWGKEVDIASGPSYFPMRSSLSFNTNNIAMIVKPGNSVGDPAKVMLEYPLSIVELDNKVETSSGKGRAWMSIEREVIGKVGENGNTKLIYHLKGSIPISKSKPWVYYRSITEPALFFQENFMEMINQHGISHRGKVLFGKAPSSSKTLAYHLSDPLRVMVADMNKYSRNLTAEHLILSMAAQEQTPAKTELGLQKIAEYFYELGIESGTFDIRNGSGLSREMKLKPSQVSAVLIDMYEDPILGPEYFASLSVGGRDGTLRRRFREDSYSGYVRGKTGSINGVYCLSTYVIAGDGEIYTFIFFANNLKRPTSFVRKLQDNMIKQLIDLPLD